MQKKLVSLLVVLVSLVGCSVKPPAVIPATPQASSTPVYSPQKETFEPSDRSNTAYPSAAARQMMTLASQQVQVGDDIAALRYLERAQRISPRAPEIYLEMAKIRQAQGQREQALQLANKAISLVGDDDALRRTAELMLRELGN